MRFERSKKHIEELKILYKLKQQSYFSKFNPTLHLKLGSYSNAKHFFKRWVVSCSISIQTPRHH